VLVWSVHVGATGTLFLNDTHNPYNNNGACPSDLQTQYATWKKEQYPPDGGFIWLYESTVSSLLSGCCGGTEKAPATTAKAYREAIANGLS
jgi:hypothetical protein